MSDNKVKRPSTQGRAPISAKQAQGAKMAELEFGNNAKSMLEIPPECAAELKAAGMEARWVDIVQLKKNHGWHKREWVPFKFKCMTQAANPFASIEGQYEGYLIRQQLVLAGKETSKVEARKRHVRMRTQMQANPGKLKLAEFNQFVKENDAKSAATGWDSKDEDSDMSDD